MNPSDFLDEHFHLTRRFFLRVGVIGIAATQVALVLKISRKILPLPQNVSSLTKPVHFVTHISRARRTSAMFRVATRCRTHSPMTKNAKWV